MSRTLYNKKYDSIWYGYLYAETLNYLMVRIFVHYLSPDALESEVEGAVLFVLRTVGVMMLSVGIVKVLKITKEKYIHWLGKLHGVSRFGR